jgi:hypothetical protein
MYRRLVICSVLVGALACDSDEITGPETADAFRGCESVLRLRIGATVDASLSNEDCGETGFFTDYYEFRLDTARDITIDLASNEFDAYLELYHRETGTFIVQNNDAGVGVNARIQGFLPAGTYLIGVSSFFLAQTGQYSLRLN